MPLLHLIIILVIVGASMWAINKYIPMQPTIKNILNIAVAVVVCIWLLNVFGIIGSLTAIHVGR